MEKDSIVEKVFPYSVTKENKCLKKRRMRDDMEFIVLSLPALVYFLLFHYAPMLGVVLAFKDYKYTEGIFASKWVGFRNFEFFFKSQDAFVISRNTILYNMAFIFLGLACAMLVALLLYEINNKWALKFYQTVMILPSFLSWVIVGYITYALFNPVLGVMNTILKSIDLPPIQWYSEIKYWPYILTITNIWKSIGLNCIIYYAALMGIDPALHEAATIDGANKRQQVMYISIPSLIPLTSMLIIVAMGNVFRGDFGLFYQIPRDVGALYPVTDVVDTYLYRGLRTGDIGITAAVGFFQSLIGLVLVCATNYAIKKKAPENALF